MKRHSHQLICQKSIEYRSLWFLKKILPVKISTLTCRIQTPGLLLGMVMKFPTLFYTKPWVFPFSHPWLLSCPWFSLFPTLGFQLFPSLATIQPLVFHFYPPLAKILSFSSLVEHILPLVFPFYPALAKILSFSSLVYNISHPWFFTFFNPWLLFSPGFSLFPNLG